MGFVADVLRGYMADEHPDVPLLPMVDWQLNDPHDRRSGRSECAAADAAGTHFRSSTAQAALAQMVLNAMAVMDRARGFTP